ncbi:MAG: YciI family protein [Verrucomicrobiota bacterium]
MSRSNEYMMLLRNTDWDEGLSVEEITRFVGHYTEWFDRMLAEGKVTGGRPLIAGGRMVALSSGDKVLDGPFIESKEAIGGFILLHAEDLAAAVEIARTFPPVQRGVQVEVRELTDICPISQRLEARLATTTN